MKLVQSIKDSIEPDSRLLIRYRDLKHRARVLTACRVWLLEARTVIGVSRRQSAPTRILLLCHSLEKGMSNPTPRRGFGVAKARTLLDEIVEWESREGDQVRQRFEWQEAVAMLTAYFLTAVNQDDAAFLELRSRFERNHGPVLPAPELMLAAGRWSLPAPCLAPGAKEAFQALVSSRHSTRYFTKDAVDEAWLLGAIEMANRSPSACNRQPTRVYYSMNPALNSRIGDLVPGNVPSRGHIPHYLVITYDRSYFEAYEAFQWLINAGIFAGYLSLSLHAYGLGSCMYQWPLQSKNEKPLRQLLGIPRESESVALIVGCGHYQEMNDHACATRRPLSDVAIRVD